MTQTLERRARYNNWRNEKRKTDDRFYLKYKYTSMVGRCYNPRHTRYSYYGGRGITVCDEWLNDPDAFVDWALNNGWKRGLTIDRIDNDGARARAQARPWAVAIGYDNYNNHLPEPSLAATKDLISALEPCTKVFIKTLRNPSLTET